MDSTLDALFELRDLFSKEKNWCAYYLHKVTKRGLFKREHSSYCLLGGVEYITKGDHYGRVDAQPMIYHEVDHEIMSACKELYGTTAYMGVNDEKGYEGAIAIIDKAIENRKSGINHLDFPVRIGDVMKDVAENKALV